MIITMSSTLIMTRRTLVENNFTHHRGCSGTFVAVFAPGNNASSQWRGDHIDSVVAPSDWRGKYASLEQSPIRLRAYTASRVGMEKISPCSIPRLRC